MTQRFAWRRILVLLAGLSVGLLNASGSAQEPLDLVMKHGTDLKILRPEILSAAVASLKWQDKVNEMQQQKISQLRDRWLRKLQIWEEQLREMNEQAVGAGGLISRTLVLGLQERQLDLEVELSGLKGQFDELAAVVAEEKKRSNDTERKLLERALQNRLLALDRLRALQKKNMVANQEVADAEVSALEYELRLQKFNESGPATVRLQALQRKIAELPLDIRTLEVQLALVRDKLKKMTPLVGTLEGLQNKIDVARSTLQELENNAAKMEIEQARREAIIELIESSLESNKVEVPESADPASENSKEASKE